MRENRPYGSEGGASQTNGTSLPPIVWTPQAALIRRKLLTIGVGGTDYIPFPLPPNRTGSSPLYAKTVGEKTVGVRKPWGHCLLCHCFGVFGEAVLFVCCGLRSGDRSISIWQSSRSG